MRSAILVVGALLLSGCVPREAPPESATQRAAECDSEQACEAVYEDAGRRVADCIRKQPGGGSCEALQKEKYAALARKKTFANTSQQKASDDSRNDMERRVAERDQLHADLAKPNVTCAEIVALETTAEQPHSPGVAEAYRKAARSRREERAHYIVTRLDLEMKRRVDIRELAAPRDALVDLDGTKEVLAELRCLDAKVADEQQGRLEAWAAQRAAAVADEEKCRSAPACMGDRVAGPLCEAIRQRRQYQQDIAKERQNPAGVVNMTYLHDLGQSVQDEDAKIAELRPRYASAAHRPFNEAVCAKIQER